MSEAMPLVATVLGVGLFWTTVTLWSVKALMDKQAQHAAKAQEQQQTDNRAEWARITETHNANWVRLQETVQRIEAAERLNAEGIHRLDLEHLRLQADLHRDMQAAYVGRKEYEELKNWIRDIHNAISASPKGEDHHAAPPVSVRKTHAGGHRGNE